VSFASEAVIKKDQKEAERKIILNRSGNIITRSLWSLHRGENLKEFQEGASWMGIGV
jgi:hypothetical protein